MRNQNDREVKQNSVSEQNKRNDIKNNCTFFCCCPIFFGIGLGCFFFFIARLPIDFNEIRLILLPNESNSIWLHVVGCCLCHCVDRAQARHYLAQPNRTELIRAVQTNEPSNGTKRALE